MKQIKTINSFEMISIINSMFNWVFIETFLVITFTFYFDLFDNLFLFIIIIVFSMNLYFRYLVVFAYVETLLFISNILFIGLPIFLYDNLISIFGFDFLFGSIFKILIFDLSFLHLFI